MCMHATRFLTNSSKTIIKLRGGLTVFFGLLFFLAIPSQTFAGVSVVTVQAEGYGPQKGDAVSDALLQAVSQVNGAEIAGQTMRSLREVSSESDAGNSYLLEDSFQSDVTTRSQGVIKSWKIITSHQDPERNGMWVVSVSAEVSKYQASKQLKRLRMAVVDFRVENGVYQKSGNTAAKAFSRALQDGLTQSRKFAMLDRSFNAEQEAELSNIANGDSAIEEMARLGNKAGTDYLIVGTITKAMSSSNQITLKTTGEVISVLTSTLSISYRIIDVATSQIKFSAEIADTQQGIAVDELAKKLAKKSVTRILNAIFPVRVLTIEDKTVSLSQGGNTLKVGQKLKLVKLGAPLIDPYTKESLGKQETTIGEIEITDVQAKYSTGRITSLKVDINNSTLIVRPYPTKSTGKVSVEKNTKRAKEKIKELEEESSDEW